MRTRIVILLLVAALILCGCGADASADSGGCSFYYPRADILYGAKDGVISCETRELPGSGYTPEQILALYLSGPISAEFKSPFPSGTKIVNLRQDYDLLTVTLSAEFFALEGMELTLACASFSRTCFALTGANKIVLRSEDGERRIQLDRESIVYFDDGDAIDMTIGTEHVG